MTELAAVIVLLMVVVYNVRTAGNRRTMRPRGPFV
jgi:hypothetical protein